MRPTRRAVVLAGLCVVGIGLALRFGARSLGALVVPMVVALAAGLIQVLFADRPELSRSQPQPGFPGESRTVTLTIEAESQMRATVSDTVPEGLGSESPRVHAGLPATIEYEIELGERGETRLGPASVRVTDVLGLFSKSFEYARLTSVLVYPEVKSLARPIREVAGIETESDERRAFDRLREYAPGDSFRDIHWKTSAKRDEFVVMEFAADDPDGAVVIAADATTGHADAMATATASLALEAIDAGLAVELTLADAHVRPSGGPAGRDRLLEALARTSGGSADDDRRAAADMVVTADGGGTRIRADGRTMDFGELVGEADRGIENRPTGTRHRRGDTDDADGATTGVRA